MQYAFILGRNPEISITELGAFFANQLKIAKNAGVAFFDGDLPHEPQRFLDRLGGTQEILEIFEEKIPAAQIENAIANFLKAQHTGGKLLFALNLFPENKKSKLLRHLLPSLKKNLRNFGISANFLNKNFANVSAVAAFKQGLIKKKTDIWIIDIGESGFSLGAAVAMQDFENYSKRDYGKPFRDAGVGMLPPKLAQMMINLTLAHNVIPAPRAASGQAPAGIYTILDPFCGTGTVLMEALLMGFSVIGSDADARLVEGSRQNIDWLKKTFPERVPGNSQVQLFEKDAKELEKNDISTSLRAPAKQDRSMPLAVVTEPYLGPPLSRFPAENFLEKLMAELSDLYKKFFANAAKWLPKGTPIVFIFPYWKSPAGRRVRLSELLIAKITSLGYSKTAFDPLHTDTLFYDRPDSVVGREIIRFIKT